MYSPAEVKRLQALAKSFFSAAKVVDEGNVEDLRDALRFHENRYYVENDPLISDTEYDLLFKKLEAFEDGNPAKVTKDSPTQRVGKVLIKDFPKAQHIVPMLSLDNSYNEEDLSEFDRRIRETLKTDAIEYCIEPKFDGASVSVLFEDDDLERGLTRGDGETGDDITPNIKQVRSMPLRAAFADYGIQHAELRGEVMMNKSKFAAYNEMLAEEGSALLANPRNAAAGTLRIKDPAVVRKRKLEAFFYHLSWHSEIKGKENKVPKTHSATLEMLRALGFKSPATLMKVVKGIEGVVKFVQDFEAKRDDLPYEIDGMVIKVNDLEEQEQMGMTSHHPRWAIAYKFKARQATSALLDVEYQVGRTGAVTPVAKIAPAQVGGITVTSISIHNEDYIAEKDLRIGDQILIERSGDVIPQIVKSLPELRTGGEKKIDYPRNCPVCGDALVRPEGEAVWRCVNINCEAQVVERINHFVSKDAMDIRGFGEANVRRFFAEGFLKDVPSIYAITADDLRSLEGFGEKSVTNLLKAIEDSKSQPLHRLIYGLGIRYVGETTAKTIAQSINSIYDLKGLSAEQLRNFEDIGVKVADSIVDFFKNYDNLKMLQALEAAGLQMRSTKIKRSEGGWTDQTFLFTGTLNKLKRAEAEDMVEQRGGKILSGVSAKLNYLIVGEDAGSKLEKAKKISTVKILSEDEFLKFLEETSA